MLWCRATPLQRLVVLWYPTRLSHSSPSQSAPVPAQETPSRNVHWDVHPRRLKPLWCRNCCPVKQQREQQVERSPASKIYLRGSPVVKSSRNECRPTSRQDAICIIERHCSSPVLVIVILSSAISATESRQRSFPAFAIGAEESKPQSTMLKPSRNFDNKAYPSHQRTASPPVLTSRPTLSTRGIKVFTRSLNMPSMQTQEASITLPPLSCVATACGAYTICALEPLTRGIFCWPPCQPSGADLPEPWMSPMPLASQMSLAPPMSLSPQVPQMPPCAEMPAKSAMPRLVLCTVSIALSSHMAGLAQRS